MSGFCGRCLASIIFFFILSHSSPVAGYDWNATWGLQGWKLHNVLSSRLTEDGVIVYGDPNSPQFSMQSPEGMFSNVSNVKISLRTMSVGAFAECTFISRKNNIATIKLPIYDGRAWREYSFALYDVKGLNVPIDSVALYFKDAEYVELKDITIKGPSFSELWITQGTNPSDINWLYPFRVYGYSTTLLFYAIAALSGLGIAAYCAIKKKRAALAMTCAVMLALYFIHDIREDYEELVIMKTHYENYLSAVPAEKRYFFHDYLVEFSRFIKRNAGDKTVNLVVDDGGYSYLEYLLYPMKVEHSMGMWPLKDVNVFCEYNNMRLDGDKLLLNGYLLFDRGTGTVFNSRAFLYKMTR